MKDVSILMESIRPQNLVRCYNAIAAACTKYTWELVIPSPYLIPPELLCTGNVKFVHTYASPSTAIQIAASLATGKYLFNIPDDGLLVPNAIDDNLELIADDDKNIINMRYNEAVLDVNTLEMLPGEHPDNPLEYWTTSHHPDLRLGGINPNWKFAMNYIFHREYFIGLGGLDCSFEHVVYPIFDLMFRAQRNGSEIINSKETTFHCSHLPGHTGDHRPIHDSHTGPDYQKWMGLYGQPRLDSPISIDFDNWKKYDGIWTRRFDPNHLTIAP